MLKLATKYNTKARTLPTVRMYLRTYVLTYVRTLVRNVLYFPGSNIKLPSLRTDRIDKVSEEEGV